MALLEVEHINKSYGSFKAVDDVSFNVEAGKIYGMLGPNGAGKTTTIRMIMNILVPDSGQIRLFGKPITEDSKAKIGYLPEERGLFQKMKVYDLLLFFAELHGLSGNAGKQAVLHWLAKLEISNWAENKVEELSKGMQQKLQFITTILHNPELVILDEPFSGLDPVNVNLLKEIMLEIKEQGKTIIFSTHMMDAAEKLCDDILMIDRGKKVLDGPIHTIRAEFGKKSMRLEYTGDRNKLKSVSGVERLLDYGNYADVELKEGFNGNDFLKEILPLVQVNSFSTRQSSLNEIFLQLAGDHTDE
jgi:ABC-2 type transport system ATP-binding protein